MSDNGPGPFSAPESKGYRRAFIGKTSPRPRKRSKQRRQVHRIVGKGCSQRYRRCTFGNDTHDAKGKEKIESLAGPVIPLFSSSMSIVRTDSLLSDILPALDSLQRPSESPLVVTKRREKIHRGTSLADSLLPKVINLPQRTASTAPDAFQLVPPPVLRPSSLFVDLCSPTRLGNHLGNPQAKRSISEWLRSPNRTPMILLLGPPGLGKTSFVSLFCKHNHLDLREINASDVRSGPALKSELREVCMVSAFLGSSQQPALLLDEMDGAFDGNAKVQGGISGLIEFLKNNIHRKLNPIFAIANADSRKLYDLKRNKTFCTTVYFNALTDNDMYRLGIMAAEKTGVVIDSKRMQSLVRQAHGDVRGMLNSLDFWRKNPTAKRETDTMPSSSFDCTKAILWDNADTVLSDRVVDIYGQDSYFLQDMLFANCTSLLTSMNPTSLEPLTIALQFAESFSTADVLLRSSLAGPSLLGNIRRITTQLPSRRKINFPGGLRLASKQRQTRTLQNEWKLTMMDETGRAVRPVSMVPTSAIDLYRCLIRSYLLQGKELGIKLITSFARRGCDLSQVLTFLRLTSDQTLVLQKHLPLAIKKAFRQVIADLKVRSGKGTYRAPRTLIK